MDSRPVPVRLDASAARRFQVLAVDYDGTLTSTDRPSPDLLAALARCRADGIVVVMVTGRILRELRAVFPTVDDHVDAIVAENGAVLAVGGTTRRLAAPIDPALGARCRSHDRRARTGEVIVACPAVVEHAVLDDVRALGLECSLIRNRTELMVLPAGITKGTGLLAALDLVGRSRHDTVAVGDAENDHSLFDVAEVAVAVANAVPALRERADVVTPGAAGDGVRWLIDGGLLLDRRRLRPSRWRLALGRTASGATVSVPASGLELLILGSTGAGKSHLAGLVAEQLTVLGYATVVIDPEGEHGGLDALPGVRVIGRDHRLPAPHDVVDGLRDGETVVVDLAAEADAAPYLAALRRSLRARRHRSGLPQRVVFDEAQHTSNPEPIVESLDPLASGQCLVTWRADLVTARQLADVDVVLAALDGPPDDAVVGVLAAVAGVPPATVCTELEPGGVAVARRGSGLIEMTTPLPRVTSHFRHEHKYDGRGVGAERRFVLRGEGGRPTGASAGNLAELDTELARCRADVLRHHCPRHDISRWITEVFHDPHLAGALRWAEAAVGPTTSSDDVETARIALLDALHRRRAVT